MILDHVRWETYEQLLGDIGPHSGVRTAFADGVLQLTPKNATHELMTGALVTAILAYAMETRVDMVNAGSAWWTRREFGIGIEPDGSFYVGDSRRVCGRELDGARDPAPDLMIDIDALEESIDKLPIFAAFGVAEVWRWTSDGLLIYSLENGKYGEAAVSPLLRPLSAAFLTQLAADAFDLSALDIHERVVDFLRQT